MDALHILSRNKEQSIKDTKCTKTNCSGKGSYSPTLNLLGNLNTFFTTQNKINNTITTGDYILSGAIVANSFEPVLIPKTITTQSINPFTKKQLNQNLSYALGVSLNVPIYNKFQGANSRKAIKITSTKQPLYSTANWK